MKRLLIAACIALSACNAVPFQDAINTPPSAVADKVVLDENLGRSVELAYKAARTAMELAVDSGLLKGANAAKAQELNRKAFAATKAVQAAYAAANSDSYIAAGREAIAAIGQFLALIKG